MGHVVKMRKRLFNLKKKFHITLVSLFKAQSIEPSRITQRGLNWQQSLGFELAT